MIQTKLENYKKIAQEKQQLVTVFMLTYNREYYVQLAIEGVLKQTYQNFQLIVLDNNSVDNTEQVITAIPDERITYIKRGHTPELPNALLALKECVTKYLIILHDDDVVNPTYLEEVLQVMEKDDLAAASVGATLIDSDGVPFGQALRPDHSGDVYFKGTDYVRDFLRHEYTGMTYPSAVYRCDFYRDFPDFAGNAQIGPAGDQWIWLETQRMGGTICFVNRPLFQYRIHKKQESNVNAGDMELQLLDHMLTKPYYQDALEENWEAFSRFVWNNYRIASRKYNAGQIDLERFRKVVRHSSIRYLSRKPKGWLLYTKIMLTYYLRGPVKILLKAMGKN